MRSSAVLAFECLAFAAPAYPDQESSMFARCLPSRPPLKPKPYLELPLGAIRPRGWLLVQLERQRDGLTGDLDARYPKVVGPRNGWLGGDGDGWERGPYWLDGLLPLAYLLKDETLIAKARPWIEWSLRNHQLQPDGGCNPRSLEQAGWTGHGEGVVGSTAQSGGVHHEETPRKRQLSGLLGLSILSLMRLRRTKLDRDDRGDATEKVEDGTEFPAVR